MRVAADTNVVVRYLTGDDPAQAEQAASALESADAVYLDLIVMCETAWVLRRAYGLSSSEIADALTELLDSETIEADRRAAEAGLTMLRAGGDFADGVILHQSVQASCGALITFDRRFARIGDDRVVLMTAP